jgi:hypothetical protein
VFALKLRDDPVDTAGPAPLATKELIASDANGSRAAARGSGGGFAQSELGASAGIRRALFAST